MCSSNRYKRALYWVTHWKGKCVLLHEVSPTYKEHSRATIVDVSDSYYADISESLNEAHSGRQTHGIWYVTLHSYKVLVIVSVLFCWWLTFSEYPGNGRPDVP